jgi:hypothetical protein
LVNSNKQRQSKKRKEKNVLFVKKKKKTLKENYLLIFGRIVYTNKVYLDSKQKEHGFFYNLI